MLAAIAGVLLILCSFALGITVWIMALHLQKYRTDIHPYYDSPGHGQSIFIEWNYLRLANYREEAHKYVYRMYVVLMFQLVLLVAGVFSLSLTL